MKENAKHKQTRGDEISSYWPINNKTLFENELTRFYLGSQVVKCSVDASINDARLKLKT
jgi:hypothetical protein